MPVEKLLVVEGTKTGTEANTSVSPIAWSTGMSADALGNLAHELRTPIQVMLGLLDILDDEYAEQMGEQPRKLLQRMNANALELGQTLDNLMTFALVQAGRPAVFDEDLTIASILADIGPTLDAANRSKGLKLCFDFKDAPVALRGPRRAIVSTLTNLALNAIKFTPAGTVTVRIRQTRAGEGAPAIVIEVSDTGPGLKPEVLEEASRPFAQLSAASARRFRGIGLGLTIVSQNVAALNGHLDLSSTPGGGATFTVRFPVRGSATAPRTRRNYASPVLPSPAQRPHRQPSVGGVSR